MNVRGRRKEEKESKRVRMEVEERKVSKKKRTAWKSKEEGGRTEEKR